MGNTCPKGKATTTTTTTTEESNSVSLPLKFSRLQYVVRKGFSDGRNGINGNSTLLQQSIVDGQQSVVDVVVEGFQKPASLIEKVKASTVDQQLLQQ